MLLLEDVVANLAGCRVLDRVSLVVPRGTCAVVVTDDAATGQLLVDLLAGVVRPDAGRVRVDGRDPATTPELAERIATAVVTASELLPVSPATDIGTDVWLVDATAADRLELGAWLDALERGTPAQPPTVLVAAGTAPGRVDGRLLVRHVGPSAVMSGPT